MNQTVENRLPHWDLSNVYPALDSAEFQADLLEMERQLNDLEGFMVSAGLDGSGQALEAEAFSNQSSQVKEWIDGYLERMNTLLRLYSTLRSYVWSFVATDSYNTLARRQLSELEQYQVRLRKASTRFSAGLGRKADQLPAALADAGPARAHAFYLTEQIEQSRYLMSDAEEGLAAELSVSGANAWGRLQGVVCSQLSVPFDRGRGIEQMPIAALQNLNHDPDAQIRQRAYEAELVAWHSVREPLAAALNGVKGASITLHKRRGRQDALHAALDQARIDRSTLEAMLSAMRESFPVFRRYLRTKARLLGHSGGLPWYDLFAPTSSKEPKFSWPETRTFICEQFATFSPRLVNLARRAFEHNWIDAEPRAGKRGGAFCMSIDMLDESRILCNFDGSLDQVLTVAHELGHAFHNDCFTGKTPLQTTTPMTLAETASIFCETIVTEAVLNQASSPQEELAILEPALIGATQVIVDISSRFLFEQEVFKRRESAELSADEFCELILEAQRATYGDGLDQQVLHPYMWAWKPHYYRPELNFYNFPYAFGMLFGNGLVAIYKARGDQFVADYEKLLASTGEESAAGLAGRFGIDLRSPAFWQESLAVNTRLAERYEQIASAL